MEEEEENVTAIAKKEFAPSRGTAKTENGRKEGVMVTNVDAAKKKQNLVSQHLHS